MKEEPKEFEGDGLDHQGNEEEGADPEEEGADFGEEEEEEEYAEGEFEKYRVIQDQIFQSDFDTFASLENHQQERGDE